MPCTYWWYPKNRGDDIQIVSEFLHTNLQKNTQDSTTKFWDRWITDSYDFTTTLKRFWTVATNILRLVMNSTNILGLGRFQLSISACLQSGVNLDIFTPANHNFTRFERFQSNMWACLRSGVNLRYFHSGESYSTCFAWQNLYTRSLIVCFRILVLI